MATRKKPDFAKQRPFKVGAKAAAEHAAKHKKKNNPPPLYNFGADPDFLPASLKNELQADIRKSGLHPELQLRMVDHANFLAQLPEQTLEAAGIQRDKIEEVAKAAHALLNKLNSLGEAASGTLHLLSREACFVTPSPYSMDTNEKLLSLGHPNLLDEAWEWVIALQAAAEYAGSQLEPSRQMKPAEAAAKGMVASLAAFYLRASGKRPPADNAAWFAKFARRLGAFMGVHFEDENAEKIKGKPFIGPRILKSGIDLAARPASK